jgi:hypothetical protein
MAIRHQHRLSPGQKRATVLALWPLLLDLLQPVMTHATIRTVERQGQPDPPASILRRTADVSCWIMPW